MFYEKLKILCDINNVPLTTVTQKLGLSKGAIGGWKKGVTPNGEAVALFAKYFEVSTDYFLMDEDKISSFVENLTPQQILNIFNNMPPEEQKVITDGVIKTYLKDNQSN